MQPVRHERSGARMDIDPVVEIAAVPHRIQNDGARGRRVMPQPFFVGPNRVQLEAPAWSAPQEVTCLCAECSVMIEANADP